MKERQSKTFVFSLVEVSFMANTKVNNKSDNKYDKRFISYSDFVIHRICIIKNSIIDIKDNYTSFS